MFAWFVLLFCRALAVDCPAGGYYCLNEEKYAWCDGDNLAQKATIWTCESGNICKCGSCESEYGPCNWVFEEVNGTCTGSAGSVLSDWSSQKRTVDSCYARSPSIHVPFALHFGKDTWEAELTDIMDRGFYDDDTLFVPCDSRYYQCSLHQPSPYDGNPSQLWIGKPSQCVNAGCEEGWLRLPDPFTAMYLGYAMDHYGINPGTLLALMAVKSGVNVRTGDGGDYWDFICYGETTEYDCFATGTGNCSAQVAARGGVLSQGPYQVSDRNMAYDMSVMPTRFVPEAVRKQGRPLMASHLYFEERADDVMETRKLWTEHMGRATIRTALELHWMHTLVFTLDRVGLRGVAWEKRTRYGQDGMEFAASLHALLHGFFAGSFGDVLAECPSGSDPVKDCGLDLHGDLAQIQTVCKALDESEEVYDYPLTWEHVESFIDNLQWSYPFAAVENVCEEIPWESLRDAAKCAFELISEHRALVDPSTNNTISLRYDWRAELAVIRAFLPTTETLYGTTAHGIDHYFYGIYSDMMYSSATDWPLRSCFIAGTDRNQCAAQPAEPSAGSRLVSTMGSILGILLPNIVN